MSGGDAGPVTIAVALLVFIEEWWRRSGAADRRRRAALAGSAGAAGGRWPVLGEVVDLQTLGVRPPRTSTLQRRAQLPYVGRHVLDGLLCEALRLHPFVLVHGPSTAGKSRSTAQAARELYPDRVVVVPELRRNHLDQLLGQGAIPQRAVVWLDDLDRHLDREGGALTAGVITRVLAIEGVRVVATMRQAAFEQFKPSGEIRPAGRNVIDLAELVDFTRWDATDRAAAAAQLAGHADVVVALGSGMGLGEYLSAGPDLVERLKTGSPPAEGVAVVRAAGDWYRVGMKRPIPEGVLRRLYPHYLPEDDQRLLDRYERALDWASEPVSGARLLTQRTDRTGIAVHDYVLDHLAGQSTPIPDAAWDTFSAALADQPEDLNTLGVIAYVDHNDLIRAERLLALAAKKHHPAGMGNFGIALLARGEVVEAEQWLRKSVATGNTDAMYDLGFLLSELGEVVEAEQWLRKSVATGNTDAMRVLASVLLGRGGLVEAEQWLRQAADAGDPGAMSSLGAVLVTQGELAEAERWLRAAASTDHPGAMSNLAYVLVGQGELAEAEQWLRTAAGTSHLEAMCKLATLLVRRGELAEAEQWLRTAADAGHPDAINDLGILLAQQRGQAEPAPDE